MEWLKRLGAAIDYIEENLDMEISYDEVARIACCSTYYFQRIFSMASAVSSAENLSAPAIGAQYLKVSPIMDTLVFALELAAARMSAKCPESLAVRPNAVSASVTISDVVVRSSPDAAARFMIPSIPSSMSEVFHPAIAI